jgi:hypothetical protein
MATSIRSRRIKEMQSRAARKDILFMHRFNAMFCLLGVRQLGEKTQLWCQRLLYSMRDDYQAVEEQKRLDVLQEKLDRQKELLKRRLSREEQELQEQRKKKTEPNLPSAAPASGEKDVWDL